MTAGLTLALALLVAAPAWAGAPTDTLRTNVERIFAVLDDAALKGVAHTPARQRAVRVLAEEALDFHESARRALGTHWEARTDAERTRFVRLFTDLIDQGYLSRLSHDGERLAFDTETITGSEAVVRARALTKSGGATPVTFFMAQADDGRWRVYDVAFEGMSLVGNYRAQFNKIIRAGSFTELVTRLEVKTRGDAQTNTTAKAPSKVGAP